MGLPGFVQIHEYLFIVGKSEKKNQSWYFGRSGINSEGQHWKRLNKDALFYIIPF